MSEKNIAVICWIQM